MNGVGIGTLVAFSIRTGAGLLWDRGERSEGEPGRANCVTFQVDRGDSEAIDDVFSSLGRDIEFEYEDYTEATRSIGARVLLGPLNTSGSWSDLTVSTGSLPADLNLTAWNTEPGSQSSRVNDFLTRLAMQKIDVDTTAAAYCARNADRVDEEDELFMVAAISRWSFLRSVFRDMEAPSFGILGGLLDRLVGSAQQFKLDIGQNVQGSPDIRLFAATDFKSEVLVSRQTLSEDDTALKSLYEFSLGLPAGGPDLVLECRNKERTEEIHAFIRQLAAEADEQSSQAGG